MLPRGENPIGYKVMITAWCQDGHRQVGQVCLRRNGKFLFYVGFQAHTVGPLLPRTARECPKSSTPLPRPRASDRISAPFAPNKGTAWRHAFLFSSPRHNTCNRPTDSSHCQTSQ